jgi:universal stress protein A
MTPKMERMLVGVDQSEASLWAAERAAWLQRAEEAVISLIHVIPRELHLSALLNALAEDATRALLAEAEQRVVEPSVKSIDVVHAKDRGQTEDEAQQAVLEFLATPEGSGVTWNVLIRDGDASRVILGEVAERHSDLLVLGTHGPTAVAQILIGSVAEAVVRAAPCDLHVARPEKHSFAMP